MTRSSLELAVNIASQSVSLPAVATCSWCQSAAEALSIARPKCIALVRVMDVRTGMAMGAPWPEAGISSRPANKPLVEAVRAAAEQGMALTSGSQNGTFETQDEPVGAMALQLGQHDDEPDPAVSILSFIGARSALIACAMIDEDHGAQLRAVIAESASNEEPAFSECDAEALQAVMSQIVDRVRMAFVPEPGETIEPLNAREVKVLESLAQGKTIREIASSMHRSTHTIHDYLKSKHRKIGVANRAELIARAAGRCGPRSLQSLGVRVTGAGDRAQLTQPR